VDQDELQLNTRVITAIKFWFYRSHGMSSIVERLFILLQDSSPLTQIMMKGKGKVPVHFKKANGGNGRIVPHSALDTDG